MSDGRTRQLQDLRRLLYRKLDVDASKAISEARLLTPTGELGQSDVDVLKSCIFIDGGAQLRQPEVVAEGVDLLRDLTRNNPNRIDLTYNLGNGLSALAKTASLGLQWYSETSDLRREGRACFETVGSSMVPPDLRGQAKTNHANLLIQSYRWLEAYELYREAARIDSANAVASSGAAKVLLRAANLGVGPRPVLSAIARRYLQQTRSHQEELVKYAGPDALEVLKELPDELDVDIQWPPDLTGADEYTRFVGENHLALSLTIEGLNTDIKRWDTLLIHSIREEIGTSHGVPTIFAMFNVLKADYLAARWLVYQAIQDKAPESAVYSDTLDYANYGIRESSLVLAQRSVIDILDRIAVAASEYLGLRGTPTSIYFWNRWHVNEKRKELKKPLEWQPEIQEEIEKGNLALIALSEIAEDIDTGGYLAPQRTIRNASTHRFVVLHNLTTKPFRKSRYVEHFSRDDFERQTISALRLVRSALIYFVEMVALREARIGRESGFSGRLELPSHHWIRGEGDEDED